MERILCVSNVWITEDNLPEGGRGELETWFMSVFVCCGSCDTSL